MALAYRGHFALIKNPRITSTGMNTSACYVFASALLELIDKESPSHLAVAFDTSEPTFRHKEYPAYKAQRDEMPEDLATALPYISKLCEGFNIPVIKAPGWEADDIIGTIAKEAERSDFHVGMVTPDKDFAQLVSEKIIQYKPSRTGSGYEKLGIKETLEKWGISRIEQVIDMLALMGDASDNIPGVPGIGPKTAEKLIAQYNSVENLLEHTSELKGKQREKVEDNREMALLSKRLVTISTQSPVDYKLEDLVRKEFNEEILKELFTELEFKSLHQRVFKEEQTANTKQLSTIQDVKHNYNLIDTPDKRKKLIDQLLEKDVVCFDCETTGLDYKTCELVGIAFCFSKNEAYYVPTNVNNENSRTILQEFRIFFENPIIEKVGHNLKYDLGVLRWHGIEVKGSLWDTIIATHLCLPEDRKGMDYLAEKLLSYKCIPITDLIGPKGKDQGNMKDIPLDQVCPYACEDVDITWQLREILNSKLRETNQERVFHEVECPLIPVLVEMEFEGIRLDPVATQELSDKLMSLIRNTTEQIYELAGEEFSINSPKQLGHILFDKLDLEPKPKKTKTGQYQTNEQVLSSLTNQYEIVAEVQNYRTWTKLKSTYLDALPGYILPKTNRIHTHYDQAVTSTGRMQSHEPNLQNIPIRTELGKEIRKAFVSRSPDFQLLAADYSQIELRIVAALSKDPNMIAAFQSGQDIHTATAANIYRVDKDRVEPEMRRKAKTVNFGILYGISAFGLSQRTGISRKEAKDLIDLYFDTFPQVKEWLDKTIEFAHEKEYVETLTGRKRYLRDINSRNKTIANAVERNAINAPIQGTAADMIKLAMTNIQKKIRQNQLKSRMLLQVHDELVFDMHIEETEILKTLVRDTMISSLPIPPVPIEVEMGSGMNWLDAH